VPAREGLAQVYPSLAHCLAGNARRAMHSWRTTVTRYGLKILLHDAHAIEREIVDRDFLPD